MVSAAGARDLAALVGADTLAGRWGDTVRQAQEDRDAIAVARGQRDPRTTLAVPDLLPIAEELFDRVISLAPTLHGLDRALAPATLQTLDDQITRAAGDSANEASVRSLAILEHQRTTLRELETRRDLLARKMEKALLALARLRYEAKRLRGR
jgi:non-ribosomal peptide synthetase component F